MNRNLALSQNIISYHFILFIIQFPKRNLQEDYIHFGLILLTITSASVQI